MTSSHVLKFNNCNIVICEFLAFIQNKMDVMDEDSMVRLCNSAFTEDGKSQRDLNDIIYLFKGTDPEEMPLFVARELQKLPAITFDHIDVTRLLKDLLLFQNDLRTIKECFITKKEFSNLKDEV
ncbi:unnamed protein product [Leptidea sinapis]|uniref:Uncharacterized protein n=1 Tax=Leptidea sinapis TaxID=189913 RepID=A0A5E4Q2X3_9NEOP|nr:unnamed protein product [Leptidea sinapis]